MKGLDGNSSVASLVIIPPSTRLDMLFSFPLANYFSPLQLRRNTSSPVGPSGLVLPSLSYASHSPPPFSSPRYHIRSLLPTPINDFEPDDK